MVFEKRDKPKPRTCQTTVRFTREEKEIIDKYLKEKRQGMPRGLFIRELILNTIIMEGEKE